MHRGVGPTNGVLAWRSVRNKMESYGGVGACGAFHSKLTALETACMCHLSTIFPNDPNYVSIFVGSNKHLLPSIRYEMAPLYRLTALLSLCLTSFSSAANAQDESVLFSEASRMSNQSLLWGPYRPNLYFGVRPRLPKSLMAGLMWTKVDDYVSVQNSKQHQPRTLAASFAWID
jgi:hypothetical protein